MEERYKEIAPKFIYYLGVIVAVGSIIFFAVFFEMIDIQKPNGNELLIIFLIFSPYSFYLFYINVSKSIHGVIDREKGTFVYGNIFLRQEVSLKNVVIVKKRFLKRNSYVVQIGNKRFYLTTSGSDLRDWFDSKNR
jgi:hypothetical protein